MDYPESHWLDDADAQWITEGPNSGGIAGWLLWREHMFRFEHSGPAGSVERGIPVATFLARHAPRDDARFRAIVADLRARGFE